MAGSTRPRGALRPGARSLLRTSSGRKLSSLRRVATAERGRLTLPLHAAEAVRALAAGSGRLAGRVRDLPAEALDRASHGDAVEVVERAENPIEHPRKRRPIGVDHGDRD